MSPESAKPRPPAEPVRAAGRLRVAQWLPMLVLVSGVSALAALLGFGLATSLQPLLAGTAGAPGWIGAVVGGVVAALAVPTALWGRLPTMPRLPHAAAPIVPAVAKRASAKVVALRAGAAIGSGNWFGAKVGAAAPARDTQQMARDGLTGAYTQSHFVAAADREWSRIRRHGEDAALLMVDVDHFKALNDQHGQSCGDALLIEITRQISATLRQYDLLARFGGGVLVVYLPHTDPLGALDVAERIRERVAAIRLAWNSQTVKTTVSAGVTGIGAGHAALEQVIADAGAALREAKTAGRNCVRAAPIPPRHAASNGSSPGAHRPAGPV